MDRLEGEIKEQEAVVAATLAELQNSQKELDQLKYQMDYLLSFGELVRKLSRFLLVRKAW